MIKIQNGKVLQQHEMLNMAHCNMIDYFQSYIRNKKQGKQARDFHSRRVLTEAPNIDNYETMIEPDKKEILKRKEFHTPRSPEKDTLQRVLQSKIIMTGSKKISKHIQNNNVEPNCKREDGQKEIYQKIRECFTFTPHQNLIQEKRLLPSYNLKRREDEQQRSKQQFLPSIKQNNLESWGLNNNSFNLNQQPLLNLSAIDKKSNTKKNRKYVLSKKLEDKQLQINDDLRNFTSQKFSDSDLKLKSHHIDEDNIQLDSINIMNSSSFKNMDFSEIQKQGVILQAERQQYKDSKKLINQNRGFERLNFASRRQKSQVSPKEQFIGLIFQDYETYTPIHSNCSRRTPIIFDIDQANSIDLSQSFVESNQQSSNYKKQKFKKINHSFF